MKYLAGRVLAVDQRLYDLFSIVSIGAGASIIVGGGGRRDEYQLLAIGVVCILSGSVFMFLRSRRSAIETAVDAERLLNQQAAATRHELREVGSPVPHEIEKRAAAATSSRKSDILRAIDVALVRRRDRWLVTSASVAAVALACISVLGVVIHLYVPANANIEETIASTTRANHRGLVDDIRLIREEIASLSALVSSNNHRTIEGIMKGQEATLEKLESIQAGLGALSARVSNLTAPRTLAPKKESGKASEGTTEE